MAFDPFEPDSLWRRKDLSNRKVLLWIFVPLLLFSLLSGVALYWAWQAADRSYVHPECACRRILKENPPLAQHQPIFALA